MPLVSLSSYTIRKLPAFLRSGFIQGVRSRDQNNAFKNNSVVGKLVFFLGTRVNANDS